MDLLLIVILAVIGIAALKKGRISISKNRELTGAKAKGLGVFYLVMAGIIILNSGSPSIADLAILIAILFIVTIVVILFGGGKKVENQEPPRPVQ